MARLLVEQVVKQASSIADDVAVLDSERLVASGRAAMVRDLYLGRQDRMNGPS